MSSTGSNSTGSGQQQQQQQPAINYQAVDGIYDDAFTRDGNMQAHWQYLLDSLTSLGAENLQERQQKVQRILRDDGASYQYNTQDQRTWHLDPVPLLLDSHSWNHVETGLLERAELFNLLLKDIYGAQELIRNGILPPEAIFAHPGFLRPCFGLPFPDQHALILHGVDMVRTQENHVCIIADHTQSPSGAGYALENRTVMARVFPSLFRDSHVHRLSMFFQTIRRKLNHLAPNGELPNIVLLTPGSHSESYFEHAYLANYLGYSVVQGRDLTVRNNYVWMKSLDGLTRVDVIFRRVDDFLCDPAELKSDSYLGVPGLLEVIRASNVAVANPLGSGILENPVLLKYLSSISEYLLGRELILPSAKTYWSKDPEDCEYILDNLRDLVIKPTYSHAKNAAVIGRDLSADELEHWRNIFREQPYKFVAQEYVNPGFSPTWEQQTLTPRPNVFRSFATAGEVSYRIMPGGLTRVGARFDETLINNKGAILSKDTWVLASEPEKHISVWSDDQGHIAFNQEQLSHLPSRVIENMFWMGRYAVRAESALRLLRTVFVQLNNAQHLPTASYRTILMAVTEVTETFPGFTHPDTVLFDNPEAELMSIVLDQSRSGSVMSSLQEMLKCSEEVKSLLSADTQRVINDIRDELTSLSASLNAGLTSAPEEALDPLVTSLLALSGLIHESMIRGYGWRFIEIGRNLERSYQSMSLLRALLVPAMDEFDEDSVLETVLLTLEALITYRRRYRARTDVFNGLELTMLDATNPRSLNYSLQQLKEHIEALPAGTNSLSIPPERRLILSLIHDVQLADLSLLSTINKDTQQREHLDNVLEKTQSMLNQLASVVTDKYFDHTEAYQQVMATAWEDEL